MRFYLILCCLSACQLINSQSSLPMFGEYSEEEKNLKECSFDKNAGAVVLLEEAVSDHDDEWRLITHHRVRIKILDKREIERGNIRIHFYSKDNFEYIANINATTTNFEEGRRVVTDVDKKSIFTDKEDNIYSSIKFAMPNVKEGSIIEYEYESHMDGYWIRDWKFQNDIPTLKSCYLLTILPGMQFQYSVQKKSNYPIIIKPLPDVGKIYFEMNNIPGLKFEPYMDAVRDYLQRVEFQQASYTSWLGTKTKVKQTWKDLAFDLMSKKEFGGVIKKDLPNTIEIKNIVAKETADSGKIAAVYNYVRNNFTPNNYYTIYASDGIKNTWEKRFGTATEINFILLNLLQSFNIEVYPLLVAERDFGKIDTTYPFIDRFNKVVALVEAGGKTYILDATQKFTPPGLTPFPLLNTIAFVVDKKEYKLIRIQTKDAYDNKISINGKIDNTGLLKGTAEITSRSYSKQLRTEKIKTDSTKFIKEILQESGSEVVVENFITSNNYDDNKSFVEEIKFHDELNISGGFVFLPYNFFMMLTKNPFIATERFTNINFGYPYDVTLQATIQLPEKSKIDKLPADKDQDFGNKSIVVSRKFKIENNTLIATILFRQNVTLVSNDQYASFQTIYKQVVELLNEPVIIKVDN